VRCHPIDFPRTVDGRVRTLKNEKDHRAVIIMHAMVDFGGGLRHLAVRGGSQTAVANSTVANAVATLIVTLPLLLYGLFILRKVSPSR
jgi:hypothetical protein